jgi:hypothetical protein
MGDPTTCDLCSNPLPNCTQCTSSFLGVSCTSCVNGNTLSSGSWPITCVCDTSGLPNCKTCVDFICTVCKSGFYLDPADNLCYPCSIIHSACSTCSVPGMCDTCVSGYTIITIGTGNSCGFCGGLINNCTECSSPTVCTNCDFSFGLTAAFQC